MEKSPWEESLVIVSAGSREMARPLKTEALKISVWRGLPAIN